MPTDRMDAVSGRGKRPCWSFVTSAALICSASLWLLGMHAEAALAENPSAPPATPAAAPPPGFQSQDISIGEPISLPFATPLPAAPRPPAPPAFPRTAAAPPADSIPAAGGAQAGLGWLGLAVDDALVTGRLVVVEIAPDGPAARAGVRTQDVLLAINGSQLGDSDELAAALAAIAPGQRVRMALGRDSRIEEVEAVAVARPVRPATAPATAPAPPMTAAPSQFQAAAPVTAPVPSVSPPATVAMPALAQPAAIPPAAFAPAMPSAATIPPPGIDSARAAAESTGGRTALGVRTVPVDDAARARFQLHEQGGAMVIGVVHDLPAARAGVPPGSVIVAINHQPVRSPQDLTQLVTQGPIGRPVPLEYVLPGGEARKADVVLQSLDRPLEQALIGGEARPIAAGGASPELAPAPNVARRVQPAVANRAAEPEPLLRVEELLRRINDRLDRLEQRFERLPGGR